MNICAWGSVAASLIILLLGLVAWKDWRAHRRWLREQDLRLKHSQEETKRMEVVAGAAAHARIQR